STKEQNGLAGGVETRLVIDRGRVGKEAHQRGGEIPVHDQGRSAGKQRDVGGRNVRIEFDRAPIHHELGQEREARGVGLRLSREVHEQNVGRAQKVLNFLGVRGKRHKGYVGAVTRQRLGVGREVLLDEGRVLCRHAVRPQEQRG